MRDEKNLVQKKMEREGSSNYCLSGKTIQKIILRPYVPAEQRMYEIVNSVYSLQISRLGSRIETLIPRQNPMRKELLLRVE